MLIRNFLLTFIAAATLSSAVAQTTTNTREYAFPPVGLGSTETAEINIVNVAANASNGTVATCSGNLLFRNATGTTIGTATPFTVTSGQIFSARLPFAGAGASGTRTALRGVVQLTVPATPRPPCALQVSLETFDTTNGATHVFVSGSGLATGGYRD